MNKEEEEQLFSEYIKLRIRMDEIEKMLTLEQAIDLGFKLTDEGFSLR